MHPFSMGIIALTTFLLLHVSASTDARRPAFGDSSPVSRRFEFEYTATLGDIREDAERIRLWLPVPKSDENQEIERLGIDITPPLPHRIVQDAEYGNWAVFIEYGADSEIPPPPSITVRVSMTVHRHETSHLSRIPGSMRTNRLLAGDQMAPLTDEVKRRSQEAVAQESDRMARMRGIYDRVLRDMSYDKSGVGWGRGDIQYACEVGKGNCTDFHSLFIGMARAQQIPAFFEIGFPLPPDRSAGEISGYHCWAWFEKPDGSWAPVDVSEADKNPDQIDYFFGTICCNRVAFSRGRDVLLDPAPVSGPVNYFIYPIAEVDGQDVSSRVARRFAFRDLAPGQ